MSATAAFVGCVGFAVFAGALWLKRQIDIFCDAIGRWSEEDLREERGAYGLDE